MNEKDFKPAFTLERIKAENTDRKITLADLHTLFHWGCCYDFELAASKYNKDCESKMNYGKIYNCDTTNGPGLRVTVFVSGCRHHCPGCFNPETWNFEYGKPFTSETISKIVMLASENFIQGVTFLGGEPMEPENQPMIALTMMAIKAFLPKKDIWLYSGYSFEELNYDKSPIHTEFTNHILELTDVLVDGEFIQDQKDVQLKFRGSSNQRVLDCKMSLELNRAIWVKKYR